MSDFLLALLLLWYSLSLRERSTHRINQAEQVLNDSRSMAWASVKEKHDAARREKDSAQILHDFSKAGILVSCLLIIVNILLNLGTIKSWIFSL